MRKKSIVFLLSAVLLLCCGCQASKPAEPEGTADAKTVKTEQYSLALPEGVTALAGEAGTMTLVFDNKEIGGIKVIDYPNAEQQLKELYGKDASEQNAGTKELANALLALIAPEGKVDHMSSFSSSSATLDVIPWPERNEPEVRHELLPKGDVFYDLFYQTTVLSESAEKTLVDSFALIP